MKYVNIQLFAEDTAETKEQKVAETVQKTEEELQAEEAAKAKAETEAKAKVEEAEKQRNAEEARKRRERERQEEIDKAKREVRVQTVIETIGVNPYNDKPIKDEDDVETYLIMKKIADEKGDPIKDYPDYVKTNKKEILKKQEEQRQREEQAQKEVDEFQAAHPDVKIEDLLKDEDFNLFADGKIGRLPLNKVYEDYLKFTSKYSTKTEQEKKIAKEEAERKAAEAIAKSKATPGSLGGSTQSNQEYYTSDQLDKMSPKEIDANWDKVLRSYDKIRKGENKT